MTSPAGACLVGIDMGGTSTDVALCPGAIPTTAGRNALIHADGAVEELPGKFTRRLEPGDRLRIETPGGGGWGTPP